MYKIVELSDTVRIPPEFIGQDLGKVMDKLVQQSFEGRLSKQHGMTVLTMDVEPLGEGSVIHGDGAIFQRVKFRALTFKPEVHELVHGIICEVVEFGAFAHIGPLDALVHMSQVMNDFVSADVANERLTGKESGRALTAHHALLLLKAMGVPRERVLIELAYAENEAGRPAQARIALGKIRAPVEGPMAAQFHAVTAFVQERLNRAMTRDNGLVLGRRTLSTANQLIEVASDTAAVVPRSLHTAGAMTCIASSWLVWRAW